MRAFGGRIPDGAFGAAALSLRTVRVAGRRTGNGLQEEVETTRQCLKPGARKGDLAFQLAGERGSEGGRFNQGG